MTTSAPTAPRAFTYQPPDTPLAVVHADEDIVVLNKPAGLLTVPGKTEDLADCLETRARAQFPTALIIHRLDKDTSGLIVLALNAFSHAHISKQFERRRTAKSYEALVWGRLAPSTGRVDQPLIADWPNRPKQHIDHENGRPATTDWEVLEARDTSSRVKLTPLTGRTHQLRVHMAHLGHPILGDNLYAQPAALTAASRLCLHATALGFTHPTTGQTLNFAAPAPF